MVMMLTDVPNEFRAARDRKLLVLPRTSYSPTVLCKGRREEQSLLFKFCASESSGFLFFLMNVLLCTELCERFIC